MLDIGTRISLSNARHGAHDGPVPAPRLHDVLDHVADAQGGGVALGFGRRSRRDLDLHRGGANVGRRRASQNEGIQREDRALHLHECRVLRASPARQNVASRACRCHVLLEPGRDRARR